ncbi:MAG TPA: prepilin-type cleavage/methylation domain-containing protein [Verrucomicrobia bacterium]|nr:prepilin-type cleavage/methylation domain-containing protein [Verrucomicrobiota bacterium]
MKIQSKHGFTLVEIMIVVAIIGLLAAIALPSFMRSRQSTQTNTCLNNLRLISWAKDQLALETGLPFGQAVVNAQLAPYLKKGIPTCPIGAVVYDLRTIGENPLCPNAPMGGIHLAIL